jgi:hypothetical protein
MVALHVLPSGLSPSFSRVTNSDALGLEGDMILKLFDRLVTTQIREDEGFIPRPQTQFKIMSPSNPKAGDKYRRRKSERLEDFDDIGICC